MKLPPPPDACRDPLEALRVGRRGWHHHGMRINLITKSKGRPGSASGAFSVSLTIRPACGLPGDYQYETDSASLLRMLHMQTDLPATVLNRFEESLNVQPSTRLLGIELSDRALTEIGYFID
jgi:hypothetical protein